ncbi:GNAT family N-acetyltransferase [Sphingomonas panacisoli]|uniref:GNAT family N-acetyltransferase n=1 Tax=Sphingomonas panacisoli TaxID=1813879 RepID=A0A5B8LFP1_9SPHN|nr:GNAT family N-acetyltransferase [Sphingomonas panacisoli]QDZ06679.1 GNAT family N-acetyltransferase [Sphingomonas panacisoli]
MEADPALITRWAEAWAISRDATRPVPRDGGLYIHVGRPEQIGRYIFASLDRDPIRTLAATIDRPLLYLKVCAPADVVRLLLPPNWDIATPGYMMTAPVAAMLDRLPVLPDGFVAYMTRDSAVTFVTIADPGGEEAARGRIIAMDDLVVFDRIRTADAHQRKGLGTAIMRTLAAEADTLGIRDAMLCATPPGRALYESIGWSLHSDYTTASLAP